VVVVVGGGAVAARKVRRLLPCGPAVQVIAPEVVPEIRAAADAGLLTWHARPYRPGDLKGARLAFAATDDPATNRAVWREARQRRVWINVADDPALCTFTVPAVLEHADLTVAVSTGSASPALARLVRDTIAQAIGPEYGTLAMLLADLRPLIQQRHRDAARRARTLRRLASADVLAALRRGDHEAARAELARLLAEEPDGTAPGGED
jgi:siroheme synthase-like protein